MIEVTIICSDPRHPVNDWLERWKLEVHSKARVAICRNVKEASGGKFLFLVSCQEMVPQRARDLYQFALVLHASDLPRGRGMSPHVWQILEGHDTLIVTLLDAADPVDSGDIWHQERISIPRTDLADEINAKLFDAELSLMTWALDHCSVTRPRPQVGTPSYYRRRTPEDSEIDADRPLADYFDLLRVADPDRYPAYFILRGQKYRIRIDKA